jgi:hypothetical protein
MQHGITVGASTYISMAFFCVMNNMETLGLTRQNQISVSFYPPLQKYPKPSSHRSTRLLPPYTGLSNRTPTLLGLSSKTMRTRPLDPIEGPLLQEQTCIIVSPLSTTEVDFLINSNHSLTHHYTFLPIILN